MEIYPLQSGSSGNCAVVRSGTTTIVLDAGISGRKCIDRMTQHGLGDIQMDALIVSHDHSDHTASLGVLHRKLAVPVHITQRTHECLRRKKCPGLTDVAYFRGGETIAVNHLRVHTIPTPHDGVDGVCFVIEDSLQGTRLGFLTDLGHVFSDLGDIVSSVDALFIESNYDEQMLRNGQYPRYLKQRIAGKGGHLSNKDAAELLHKYGGSHLQWVCLAHLSDHNNSPLAAVQTHRQINGSSYRLSCADRTNTTERLTVASFQLQAVS